MTCIARDSRPEPSLKVATITTSDPVDPLLSATACVRTSIPKLRLCKNSCGRGHSGLQHLGKGIYVAFVLVRCRKRNADVPCSTIYSFPAGPVVSGAAAYLQVQIFDGRCLDSRKMVRPALVNQMRP